MDLAARYAVAVHSGSHGEIRVGVASSRTGGLFREVLRQFQTLFPSVSISLTEDATSKTSHYVAMGELDVAFLIGGESSPVCETKVLWREGILAVLATSHHLTGRQVVTWDDIRDETFILSKAEQGSDIQHRVIARLTEAGHRPKFAIQDISNTSVFDLVAMGCGITLADESSARRAEGLQFIPLANESEALAATAIWRPDNANPVVPHLITVAAAVGRGEG